LFCGFFACCVFAAQHDDIELTGEQKRDSGFAYAISDNHKWPQDPKTHMVHVPIEINTKDYSKDELDTFHKGKANIEKKTCIRFITRKKQKDYVYVSNGGKCSGGIGKSGGRQDLHLTPECMKIQKKCSHELIHILGFHHMHQRYDRDTALNILWDNIKNDDKQWFNKLNNKWEAFGTDYDLKSVMHYASNGFSKNGKNTMVAKDGSYTKKMGHYMKLSKGDATRINRMYKCKAPYS